MTNLSPLGNIGKKIGQEVAEAVTKATKESKTNKTKKIFRGLEVSKKTKLKTDEPIGKHWSSDKEVAQDFAGRQMAPQYDKKNVLIEAEVDRKDILKGEEALDILRRRDYVKHEKEVPIKPGAKVKVTRITTTNTRNSGKKIKVTAELKEKYSPFLDDEKIGSYVQINPVVKSRRRIRKYPNGKELRIDNE
jgi:hypothetical protein